MRRPTTLSGQLLALQMLIVVAVLAGVTAVSISQSGASFQRNETRRAMSAAENVAGNPLVRARLLDATAGADSVLPAAAETSRSLSGARSVLLVHRDGTILTSADPRQVGTRLAFGDPSVPQGRAWSGLTDGPTGTVLSAQVPVFAPEAGRIVGVAVVEYDYPSVLQRWQDAVPNLAAYLGISGGLGVVGSLLVARRLKRQTLGLEPQEIAGLVEHHEAMLHGVKEGVVGVDLGGRVTLVNDSACDLLGIPVESPGRRVGELGLAPDLVDLLMGRRQGVDLVALVGDRLLTLNRKPMSAHGRVIGSVTTLRDRTELSTLRRELGVVRQATDTLRAQTHEFTNRLHVISGLLQLEEYDDVVRFIDQVTAGRAALDEDVTSRVRDPAIAALLMAKSSLAAERGATLRLAPTTSLDRTDDELSTDLTTVVGNLVDNALDAVSPATAAVDAATSARSLADGAPGPGLVEVDIHEDGTDVVVVVRDNGPGVPDDLVDRVFDRGFTTKDPEGAAQRGFGLALTGLVCRRRGGDIRVSNDGGAVFTGRLPRVEVRA